MTARNTGAPPRSRRDAGRWAAARGWGGPALSAAAAVCALTSAAVLLPLTQGAGSGGTGGRAGERPPVTSVAADDCTEPERSLTPSAADGPSVREIQKRRKLIVGVDQNSYRWGYRDPATGDLMGFDIDLARAIAEDLLDKDGTVVFRAVSTDQRAPLLQEGKLDLVVRTMTITCKRAREVAFSTAYFETGQQVLAPRQSKITGHDASLKGKKVCTAEGSTAFDALEENAYGAIFRDPGDGTAADEDILTVPNQLDCLVRVQEGLADAVVTDSALAAGQAAQDPTVELKGPRFKKVEYYGVAAAPGKDDLVRRVNKVLEEYREDGRWLKAYQDWLAEDLPGVTEPPEAKYHLRER